MKHRLLVLIVALVLAPLAILARNYDVSVTDASPETALQAIKKATGYEFVYNKGVLAGLDNRKVSGSFHDMSLEQILNRIVNLQLGLDFEIVVYEHKVMNRKIPLVRGFDDDFLIPHSRHTAVPAAAIHGCKELLVLAESEEAGVLLCMAEDGKQIFVMGHPEYDRMTLHNEYLRDKEKGLPIQIPKNYYPDDDPTNRPKLQWRSHSNNLYTNWLNYYVYQVTDYVLE